MANRQVFAMIFFLVMFLSFSAVLAVGCGGELSGSRQQGGGGQEAREQNGGEAAGDRQTRLKIALGSIQSVKAEKGRFTLKPSAEAQGEKPIPFKLAPEARVTLDGREAEPSQMKPGQQAQVEYVVREDLAVPNRARVVELFSTGGG